LANHVNLKEDDNLSHQLIFVSRTYKSALSSLYNRNSSKK